MTLRRVVITGLGMVSPLGGDVWSSWKKLIAGASGIRTIDTFDTSDLPTKIAAIIPRGDQAQGKFHPDDWMSAKEQDRVDPFILYGVAAAVQAVEDAGWKPQDEQALERTGVLMGSGIGGLETIYKTSLQLANSGPRRVSPFFIPSVLINLLSGHVAIRYGFKGPNHAVVTACATSAHAIGDAARLIKYGDADVMVTGGAEAPLGRLSMAGFCSARAMSTRFNDTPHQASRPWDRQRDGFVMGEGGAALVLEELEHAKARGAKIYGEVLGYGLSGDAYHITSPAENGEGAHRAMVRALQDARIDVTQLDYINAHGTSTPQGDLAEVSAMKHFLGAHQNQVCVSSTKSSTGHLLGAAGALEAIFTTLSLREGILPPTLNLDDPDEGCDLDFVPHHARDVQIRFALTNSFGFGGTNASLVLARFEG